MKSVLQIVLSCAVASGALCSCSGGGSNNSSSDESARSSSSSSAQVRDIPSRLGNLPCSPLGFNNAEEVLLACSPDLTSIEAAVRPTLAIWRGGDSLEPVPDPVEGRQFLVTGFTDNGTIVGNVIRATPIEANGTAGFDSGYATGFIWQNGSTQYLEKRYIGHASSSGEYLLTGDVFDDGSTSTENTVLHNGQPVTYAAAPNGLFTSPSNVNDLGSVSGFAFPDTPDQSFSARYGYTQDPSHFNLYPSPGRPEVSAVDSISLNDRGTILLEYDSGLTYPFHFTDIDGHEVTGTSPVRHALVQTAEGTTVPLDDSNPALATGTALFNNKDVVMFYRYDPAVESSEFSTFFYSPRSGVQPADSVFPGLGAATVYYMNDKNQIVVDFGGATGDGSDIQLKLVQLPSGL